MENAHSTRTHFAAKPRCAEYRRAAEAYRRLIAHRKQYYAEKLSLIQPKLVACGGNAFTADRHP